jgi:XTP/dITP diphosphohydrolase
MELIFATANANKVKEVQPLVPENMRVLSLADIGFTEEVPETSDTIEGNSDQKASFIFGKTGRTCFSEDTGLEVEALHGAPGVYTGRYAGEYASHADNIKKLLGAMQGIPNRNARFKTVITLLAPHAKVQFEGICNGEILEEITGEQGFGYDPVFKPTGSDRSFAQMTMDEKNKFSHRKKAFAKLLEYLNTHSV